MNRRNAACILDHNPRRLYPLVDDKLRMQQLCDRIGVPTPEVYAVIGYHSDAAPTAGAPGRPRRISSSSPIAAPRAAACWSLSAATGSDYMRHNGEPLRLEQIRQHLSDILSGMYSLGGRPDQAILQQRVRLHPAFEPLSYKGIPDMRVILYRNEPAMAMLRLPTKESNGRANLHQGGIGTGVDLDSGVTQPRRAAQPLSSSITPIPACRSSACSVPYWQEVLDMSRRVAAGGRAGLRGRGHRRGRRGWADAAGGQRPAGAGDPDRQRPRSVAPSGGDRRVIVGGGNRPRNQSSSKWATGYAAVLETPLASRSEPLGARVLSHRYAPKAGWSARPSLS